MKKHLADNQTRINMKYTHSRKHYFLAAMFSFVAPWTVMALVVFIQSVLACGCIATPLEQATQVMSAMAHFGLRFALPFVIAATVIGFPVFRNIKIKGTKHRSIRVYFAGLVSIITTIIVLTALFLSLTV
jgi:hypothetical protein